MAESAYQFTLHPVDVPPVETAYRRIQTPQPPPATVQLLRRLRAHEPESMSLELPVAWDRASGFQVEDSVGNRWLDFTSGIFVANVGHAHPRVREAIVEMAQRPLLHSYSFPTEVRARLVEKLVAVTPAQLDTVVLLTTGSEANEVVIKLARLNGLRSAPEKLGIISLTFGFHGKTMGAQTASGRPEAKRWIGKLDPNFHQLPVPYAPLCPWDHDRRQPCGAACFRRAMESLEDAGVDLGTVAAFLVEPFQGWSAAFLPDDYVQAMRAWADAHGALLCFDEVQSGIGRTGRFFAHEHFGVAADLVSCGKGISSSLPVSAVLGPRNLVDVDDSLHSTHGANPVCCAAALANLETLAEEQLLAAAVSTGELLGPRLRQIADRSNGHVSRVEGRGMVWALHLTDPVTGELDSVLGDMVIERAMRRGVLLVRTGTGTIKVGPPLGIPLDAAMEGVEVIEEALVEALTERSQLKR